MRFTIVRIGDKFEANGTVQNGYKKISGKPRSLTNFGNEARFVSGYLRLQFFNLSPGS